MSELTPAVADKVKAAQRSLWASGDYATQSVGLWRCEMP